MFKWLLAAFGALGAVYTLVVRPRMLRWGATQEEFDRPFPDAGIVPGGTRGATMATTIDAPPREVWPWLVQMGIDRGGWYSFDRLDAFGRRSTHEIHPEWQDIKVGDRLVSAPNGSEWWEVAAVEPERFLALRASVDLRGRPFDPHRGRPRWFTDSTWSFLLEELPEGRTRLIVSGSWAFRPHWMQPILSFFVLEPSHWIMQTRQFHNLRERVEHAARTPEPVEVG